MAGIGILQLEARLEGARRAGGKHIFRFGLAFRLLIIGAAGTIGYYAYRDWTKETWWIDFFGTILILVFLLSWPPTVLTSDKGIEYHVWWKPRVFIPWDQVLDAEINHGGDMKIVGTEGSVSISRFQIDAHGFQEEVLSRSKVKKFSLPESVI
jgi:hypothetical protein